MSSAGTGDSATSALRVALVGPMPPPLHGQTVVMEHMVAELSPYFPILKVANDSVGDAAGWTLPFVKLRRTLGALWTVRSCDVVYIAVKAGHGMWITATIAAVARLARSHVFLHHHSYAYVRERKKRMVALQRAAGPSACHIVLSRTMARDLTQVMPEIKRCIVVGNAGLIDKSLTELELKADSSELVLGHLSDLSLAKGLGEVVELAVKLNQAGVRARLVVGGPRPEGAASRCLDSAADQLGELFEYRGILAGEAKHRFYEDITHFIFPSRYVHEAVPLVLFEAIAAGVVCVSTRQGSIAEQLDGSPSIVADSAETFVEETLPILAGASVSSQLSLQCREAYFRALAESEVQIGHLVESIKGA